MCQKDDAQRLLFCLRRSACQKEMVCLSGADPENMASHAGFHVRTHRTDSQVDGRSHKLPVPQREIKFPCEIIYGQ